MIGNAQTSVEKEQSVMKLFQLMGSPAFQSIVQRPEFPAGDFFIWLLNELNYRQINTLSSALHISSLRFMLRLLVLVPTMRNISSETRDFSAIFRSQSTSQWLLL